MGKKENLNENVFSFKPNVIKSNKFSFKCHFCVLTRFQPDTKTLKGNVKRVKKKFSPKLEENTHFYFFQAVKFSILLKNVYSALRLTFKKRTEQSALHHDTSSSAFMFLRLIKYCSYHSKP